MSNAIFDHCWANKSLFRKPQHIVMMTLWTGRLYKWWQLTVKITRQLSVVNNRLRAIHVIINMPGINKILLVSSHWCFSFRDGFLTNWHLERVQIGFALLAVISVIMGQEFIEQAIGPEQSEANIRPKRQYVAGVLTGAAIEHHHHNHHGGHYNSYPGTLSYRIFSSPFIFSH